MSNNWDAEKATISNEDHLPIKLQQEADLKTHLSYDRELLLHYQGKGWFGSVFMSYMSLLECQLGYQLGSPSGKASKTVTL